MKQKQCLILVFSVFWIALFFLNEKSLAENGVFQKPTDWNYIDEVYTDGVPHPPNHSSVGVGDVKKCRYGDICDGTDNNPYHAAIDYNEDGGSDNVNAAAEGEVVNIIYNGNSDHGMGNVVILKHYCLSTSDCPPSGKVYSLYAHLSEIEQGLSIGNWVHRGEKIGEIGGSSMGCVDMHDTSPPDCNTKAWPRHLHFEIKKAPVLHQAVAKEECLCSHTNLLGYGYDYLSLAYGYSPQSNPDACGYFNPEYFIGNVVARDLSTVYAGFSDDPIDGSSDGHGITGFGYAIIPDGSPDPDLPDFILDELKITDTSDHERYAFNNTDRIELHSYSKNIGDADWAAFNGEPEADDIYVKFYLSNGYKVDAHSDWDCVGTQQIQKGNLDVGDTKHEEDALNLYAANDGTPLAPGVYNIVACVDRKYDQDNGDGEVPEKHKSNNCSSEAVFIVKEPNLRVSELFTGGRTVLNPGEQIILQTWTVNDGANVSSDIKLRWYLSSGDVYNNPILIEEDNMLASNLETGETKSEEALFTAPLTPGTYTLSVHTDALNVLAEINENDNWQHVTFEVPNVTEPPAAPAGPAILRTY